MIHDDEFEAAQDSPGLTADHDLHAEQRVLAQMLASKDIVATVANRLRAVDFAHGHHRAIFEAMIVCIRPADLSTRTQ